MWTSRIGGLALVVLRTGSVHDPSGYDVHRHSSPHLLCETGSGHGQDGRRLQDSLLYPLESWVRDGCRKKNSGPGCEYIVERDTGSFRTLQLTVAPRGCVSCKSRLPDLKSSSDSQADRNLQGACGDGSFKQPENTHLVSAAFMIMF